MPARDLCLQIRDYAVEQGGSGERAILLLRDIGILSSDDIGEIVFGMVGVGLLRARPEDRPGDFVGLFTLEELFAAEGSI